MTKSYQFHLTEQSYRWIVSCLFCQKTSFVVCESKGPIFHRLRFHNSEVYEGSHEYYNTLLQGSNSFSNYSLQHPKPFQFVPAFEFALLKALSLHCYHYILNAYFVSNEFHLSMDCFICSIVEGEPELLEHESACWLSLEHLSNVNWLPADVLIVDRIQRNNSVFQPNYGS